MKTGWGVPQGGPKFSRFLSISIGPSFSNIHKWSQEQIKLKEKKMLKNIPLDFLYDMMMGVT